jgi:MYXO-CTERM domain-containing protein
MNYSCGSRSGSGGGSGISGGFLFLLLLLLLLLYITLSNRKNLGGLKSYSHLPENKAAV